MVFFLFSCGALQVIFAILMVFGILTRSLGGGIFQEALCASLVLFGILTIALAAILKALRDLHEQAKVLHVMRSKELAQLQG